MQEFDESNQEIYLEQHIDVVRTQAFHMKKSLDQGNLREALKFSSTMLAEMKTSKLTPRNYFNLCKLTYSPLIFDGRYDGVRRVSPLGITLHR